VAERLRAIDLGSPSLLTSKPVKCYNRKRQDSKFLNMYDSVGILCPASLFWCGGRLGPMPKVADWIQSIFGVGG